MNVLDSLPFGRRRWDGILMAATAAAPTGPRRDEKDHAQVLLVGSGARLRVRDTERCHEDDGRGDRRVQRPRNGHRHARLAPRTRRRPEQRPLRHDRTGQRPYGGERVGFTIEAAVEWIDDAHLGQRQDASPMHPGHAGDLVR